MTSTSSSSSSSTTSLATTLSPLSPLITYTPCISCDWTVGWKQGWNNSAAWDGVSQRWAEAWAVGTDIGVELEFEGTSLSFLTEPTSAYQLTLSINSTEVKSISDMSATSSVNITDLPFGTHSFSGVFRSIDDSRASSQADVARLLGITIGWDNLTSTTTEPSVLDDSAWETNKIELSSDWNLMSASNLDGNIVNETQAETIRSMISSFYNQSISWTSSNGSYLEFTFTGNYLNVMTAIQPSLAQFVPSIDGVAYPTVNLSKNMAPADMDSSTTFKQIGWRKAGLGSGDHTFRMTNMQEGGLMMVDYWEYGSAAQAAISGTTTSSSSPSSVATSSNTSSSTTSNYSESSLTGIWVAVAIAIVAGICLILLIIFKAIQRRRRQQDPTLGMTSGGSTSYPNFFSSPATTMNSRAFGLSARQPFSSSPGPDRQAQFQPHTRSKPRPFSRLINPSDLSVDSGPSTPTAPLWPKQDDPSSPYPPYDQPDTPSLTKQTDAAGTTRTSIGGRDRQNEEVLGMIAGQSPAMASVVTFTPQGTTRQVENAPIGLSAEIGDMSSLGVPTRDDGSSSRSGRPRSDTAYSQSMYSVDGSLRSEPGYIERNQMDDKLGRLAQSHGVQINDYDPRNSYFQDADESEDADEYDGDGDDVGDGDGDNGVGGRRRRRRTEESLSIGVSSMMMSSPAGETIEMKSGIHRRYPSIPSQKPDSKQTGNYF
ncbi:hypothetical protein [Phaffia rhodozyma]|uniref:Uncharacterized protein n=1 Tax=Phaffia rhodozyma TaxID=264483 RepID=A0A0F7SNA4_PHARH|nr:hypothetical protein [Phaffia rhodozyma]